MEETILDKEPKSESSSDGPLDKRRNNTDWLFIIAFIILHFAWVGIAAYSFCNAETLTIHIFNVMHHLDFYYFSASIIDNYDSISVIILEFVLFILCFWTIFIILCRWMTRVFVCSAIVLKFIGCIWLIYLMSYSNVRSNQGYWFIYILCFLIVILIIVAYGLLKIGLNKVCKVLTKSCRVIFFYPSSLFYILIQSILCILVVIYGCAIFAHLNSIRVPHISSIDRADDLLAVSNGYLIDKRWIPPHIYFFHAINIFASYWTSMFIMGIGRMTLTAAFATWYSKGDKNEISFVTVPKCFVMTMRYHAGTIAYASSLLWLVAMPRIVSKSTQKLKKLRENPLNFLAWIMVLLRFPFDALTVCAIHGSPFYKSAKNSYELAMKNPVTYLTIDMITDCLILFGSFVVIFITGLSMNSIIAMKDEYTSEDISKMATAVSAVLMISSLISLSIFALFRAASSTIRLCYFEDSKFNRESEMKLYDMQIDDVSLHEEQV